MSQNNPQRLLAAMTIMVVVAAAQIVFLFRYIARLPGDTLGIALYVATIVLAVVAAVLSYTQWRSAARGAP